MEDFLRERYWGNTVQDYLVFVGTIAIAVVAIKLFRVFIFSYLRQLAARTKTSIDDFLLSRYERDLHPVLYVAVTYFSLNHLKISEKAIPFIHGALIVVATFYSVRFLTALATYALEERWLNVESNEFRTKNVRGLIGIIRIVIWALGTVFLLDNLGFEISAIITGLGIGGIAVALAAQAVLGDFFAYFAIFFDRPFEVGDFIVVDQFKGTVEYIGMKTTRLRSVDGEQIIIGNSNLTNSRLRNFKKTDRKRVVFTFGVTYETPKTAVARIPQIIREIVEDQKHAKFDRAHFMRFGPSSLEFECSYLNEGAEFIDALDLQHSINLQIMEKFENAGIRFAFPTQTVYVHPAGGETPADRK